MSMSSLLLSDSESEDSVLMSSGSSRAKWLSLTSTVLFEFFGWMNEVFFPLRMMKVAGTVGEIFFGLKRTRSHRSKLVTAESRTLRLSSSSTRVLPRILEVFQWVIKARCRKAANDTFRFGLQAWIARFTVSLDGRWEIPSFYSPVIHTISSLLPKSGPLSDTNILGIPNLAKIWFKCTFTVCEVLFPAGKASIQTDPASTITKILPWSLT